MLNPFPELGTAHDWDKDDGDESEANRCIDVDCALWFIWMQDDTWNRAVADA